MKVTFGTAFVVSGLVLAVTAIAATDSHATTWDVPGDMSNTCTVATPSCDTIAGAIAAATAGDDIQVAAGTFSESGVLIDKMLTIAGAGPASTFVDPAGGIGLLPKADGIVLRDLTIQNGSDGLRFELPAGTIDDTELDNVHLVGNSSDGIELSGSTTVTNLRILGSTFTGNSSGVRMASTSTVDGLTVTGSTFDGNSIGIYQANDAGTSTLANLSVTGSAIQSNGFAGIYVEEIVDSVIEGNTFDSNGRGILLFKGYATSGVDVGNVAIRDNDFIDSTAASVQLVIQATGLASPIDVEGNAFAQDVGVLTADWGSLDIRLGNSVTHAAVNVADNDFALSGAFGVATAAYGVVIRGNGPVVISGNVLDGGNVGGAGTTPPTSGIFIRSVDSSPNYGTIPATATFDSTCNRILGFENGVSIYDSVGLDYGGLQPGTAVTIADNSIAGNTVAGLVNGNSPPTILAENNWWGCAAGPGNPGCDDALGDVDVDPASASAPSCAACVTDGDCNDGNPCTEDTCDGLGVCANAAEPIDAGLCLVAQKSQLQVRSNANPDKNQLKWKWVKGDAFDQALLGSPDVDTEYVLCVYDANAAVRSLATAVVVAPGGAWQSKAPKGWKYKDKSGTSDGAQQVQLKTGAAGKTKAQLKARGLNLPMPVPFSPNKYFKQDPSVIVQLVNGTGTCWTSEFSPAGNGTKKNDGEQFKAKSP